MSKYIETEGIWRYGGVQEKAVSGLPSDDLDTAITGASGLVDSHLRSQFTLPLTTIGDDIKRCVAIIAAYDLLSGRGFDPTESGDDNLRLRFEDCMKWLKDISTGKVIPDVVDSSPGEGSAVGGRARIISASQRGFSIRGTSQDRGPFQGD